MKFGSCPKQRIQRWRKLRKRIGEVSNILEQLQVVLDFWKTTPIGTRPFDPFDELTRVQLGNVTRPK